MILFNKIAISVLYLFSFILFITQFIVHSNAQTSVQPLSCYEGNDPTIYRPKVLQINFDPYVTIDGQQVLLRDHMKEIDNRLWPIEEVVQGQHYDTDRGWSDPVEILPVAISAMSSVSDGKVQYELAETITTSNWDYKLEDGSTLTSERFFTCFEQNNREPEATVVTAQNDVRVYGNPQIENVVNTLPAGTQIEATCQRTNSNGLIYIVGKIVGVSGFKAMNKTDIGSLPVDFPICGYCTQDLDIADLDARFNICEKANNGEIDEVWFWGPRYGIFDPTMGGIETTMITPTRLSDLNASHGETIIDACDDIVPVVISNYTYTTYNNVHHSFLHYMGHRMERFLENYHTYRLFNNGLDYSKVNRALANFGNLTEKYTGRRFTFDRTIYKEAGLVFNEDISGCGAVHADPLSTGDYLHHLEGTAESNCYDSNTGIGYDYLGVMSLQSIANNIIDITCNDWNCTGMGWHKYWLERIPHNLGNSEKGLKNNWWEYFVNPAAAKVEFEEENACVCPTGYLYNPDTGECDLENCNTNPFICSDSQPVCNQVTGQCVECTTNDQCPASKGLCTTSNICQDCNGVIQGSSCVACEDIDASKPRYNDITNQCESCPAGTDWDGIACVSLQCSLDNATYGTAIEFLSMSTPAYDIISDSFGGIYISKLLDNTIEKYTPEGNLIYTAITEDVPVEMILNQTKDTLYVVNETSQSVTKISAITGDFITNYAIGDDIKDLAVDQSDNLYIASNTTIYKITPTGVQSIFINEGALDLTVSSSNQLWSTDGRDISKYTNTGVKTDVYTIPGYDGTGPLISSDGLGNIYFLTFGSPSKLFKVNNLENISAVTTISGGLPSSLYVDISDNVYFTDSNGLYRVSSTGVRTTISSASNSFMNNPGDMTMDITGNIYIIREFPYFIYKLPRNVDIACNICPATAPNFNSTTNNCEQCTGELEYNPFTNTCEIPTCNNGMVQCGGNTPYCSSTGECVQCESAVQCGGSYPVCENNICINCDYFDPVTQACVPAGSPDNPSIQVWNGTEYETSSCANGGITCEGDYYCDESTNTCVECYIDDQCTQDFPICNVATNTCESCPVDKPYWGPVYSQYIDDESTIALRQVITLTSLGSIEDTINGANEIVEIDFECQTCPDGTIWDGSTCVAVSCTTGLIDCSIQGLECDINSGLCVECIDNNQCSGDTPYCGIGGSCEICPTDTPFYNSLTDSCEACSDGLVWFNGQCIAEDLLNIDGQVLFTDNTPIEDNTINLSGITYQGEAITKTVNTDSTGYFNFQNMIPGNYQLEEIQQPQYNDGIEVPGTIGGDISTNDIIANIELRGFSSSNNTFYEEGRKVSGFVMFDRDNSLTMNAGDTGIENIEIQLTGIDDLNNNITLSTSTLSDGSFEFTNLRPGIYELEEIQPNNFMDSIEIAGTDTLIVDNDKIGSIVLYDSDVVNNTFLEKGWNINGYVLFDVDNSDTYTSLDSGIPNVNIEISGLDVFGVGVSTVLTTDNTGLFSIDNLAPGDYTVTETQPINYIDSVDIAGTFSSLINNDQFNITITNGSSENNYFMELGYNISGYVLYDIDNNQLPSLDDVGIENNEIQLTGTNILGQNVSLNTYTDASGLFIFTNLAPGTYQLEEFQLEAFSDSIDIATAGAILVENDVIGNIIINNSDINENYFLEGGWKISGHVFLDNERDKDYDGKEKLLDGITLELRDENNKPIAPDDLEIGGIFDPIVEVTDDGYYEFTNIPNGTYFVVQHQPDEYGSTTTNKVEVTVFNSNVENIDFGEKGGVIRGYLFGDENGNGKIDGNEKVFDDVEIIITGPQDYKEKIRTNENGQFRVRGLEKGKYKINIPKYGFEMTINIDAGEEELNILIDLLPYILSSNLEQTGMDLRINLLVTLTIITSLATGYKYIN